MSMRERLKEIPLTTVTVSFLAGFTAGSGLGTIVGTGLGLVGGTSGGRVMTAAWPELRKALSATAKESATDFAKDIAASVFSKVSSRG